MTHATPRPWKVAGIKERRIEGANCEPVIEDGWTPGVADAALIVQAVNTHDRAKAALHAAYEELNQKETTPQDRAEVLQMVRQVLEKMA